jgi:hypothetical protein
MPRARNSGPGRSRPLTPLDGPHIPTDLMVERADSNGSPPARLPSTSRRGTTSAIRSHDTPLNMVARCFGCDHRAAVLGLLKVSKPPVRGVRSVLHLQMNVLHTLATFRRAYAPGPVHRRMSRSSAWRSTRKERNARTGKLSRRCTACRRNMGSHQAGKRARQCDR